MIILHNENFKITEENGKIYLENYTEGYPLKDFNNILELYPRIKLSNFNALKGVLVTKTTNPVEIGYWVPNIEVDIARDRMSASLHIHETFDTIFGREDQINEEIREVLEKSGVVHGILKFELPKFTQGKAYIIARGTPPVKGEDAVITYLPKPDRKPVIKEDGKADYYDMNFISEISEGSWLGEKVPASPGMPGMNVVGESIPSTPGKDSPLKYDKKSAYEVEEFGKIVLRSKIAGVLEHGKSGIGVNRHLPIAGDVGVGTGNLEFDGSISIKGTVAPGFTVIASGDISIEGVAGVSGAKLIKSIEGDVYIRGGIFGLGHTLIEAGNNIYVKHVNEAILKAENEIHIGSYAIGSKLEAYSILLDQKKGKLIGGTALAKSSIVTAISGNHLERRTELIIDTINKEESFAELQFKANALKERQDEINKLQEKLNKLELFLERLTNEQIAVYEQTKQTINLRRAEAQHYDREIKIAMEALRHAGKEFIQISKEAYPGTFIKIGKKAGTISKLTSGKFLIEFGELNI